MILICCPIDNGGQGIALCNALNKYTDLSSRCMTIEQSYLNYETDIVVKDTSLMELRDQTRDADFFIFMEGIPQELMNALELPNKVSRSNTIIRTGGTHCRTNADMYLLQWIRDGYMFAGGYHDWTLLSRIGRIAFTKNILPVDVVPVPEPPQDGKIRIAFSPTKMGKGVTGFGNVSTLLTDKYPDIVEPVIIANKSWQESLALKATCNVTFDQFMIPAYANSAIESMYLNHTVFSRIDSWTRFLFPDLPVIAVDNERQLFHSICESIDIPEFMDVIGKKGHEFVLRHHHPEVVAMQWEALIDVVKSGQ